VGESSTSQDILRPKLLKVYCCPKIICVCSNDGEFRGTDVSDASGTLWLKTWNSAALEPNYACKQTGANLNSRIGRGYEGSEKITATDQRTPWPERWFYAIVPVVAGGVANLNAGQGPAVSGNGHLF